MTKRDLPPRCYLKHGAFFYVTTAGKWVNLGRDKTEALRKYSTLALAAAGDTSTMPGLVDVALPSITDGKAESTAAQYAIAARRIKTVFAEFRVEDVRPKHIAQVKLSLRKTPNMANRILSVLRLLFAFAVEHQLCEWNPTVGIKPYPEKKRDRLISHDEIEKVLAVAPARLRVMVTLLRLTGQRIQDVISMRRNQITEDGLVFVQKKTGAKLLIRWNPDLRAAVDEALALHPAVNSLTLFRTRGGGAPAYKTVYDQWCTAVKRAKLVDANIHDLRAVAITDAWRQGQNPRALAGHSSQKMTERYIREKVGEVVDAPALSKKVSNFPENR